MTTLAELIAQDAELVFTNGDEFGEPTEYRDSQQESVRVSAVWDDGVPIDAGFGVAAIQRTVHVPSSLCLDRFGDTVTPRKGGRLTRRPEQAAAGLSETWDVLTVTLELGMHICLCQKGA